MCYSLQVIQYTLSQSEVVTIWPDEQNLVSFFESGTGDQIMSLAVSQYITRLKSSISTIVRDVNVLKTNVEDGFDNMELAMNSYIINSQLDATFVM